MTLTSPEFSEKSKTETITLKVSEIWPSEAVTLEYGRYLLGRKPIEQEAQKEIEQEATNSSQQIIFLEPEVKDGIEQVSRRQLAFIVGKKGQIRFRNLSSNNEALCFEKNHPEKAGTVKKDSFNSPKGTETTVILIPADENNTLRIEITGSSDGMKIMVWRSRDRYFFNEKLKVLNKNDREVKPTVPVINEPRNRP